MGKNLNFEEVRKYLKKCGWSDNEIGNLDDSLIDTTISLKKWKNTFVGAFCTFKRMPHVLKHLAKALENPIPVWEDFTMANVKIIVKTIAEYTSANTARMYMAHIVSVLNTFRDSVPEIPKVDTKKAVAVIKKTPSQHIVLNEREINMLIDTPTKSTTEEDVKRAFLIEALCGARTSDAQEITLSNIQDGWIVYVSKKTKTLTQVPVHKKIIPLLSAQSKSIHNRSVFNVTLQRLCRRAGIVDIVEIYKAGERVRGPKWQFVSTHTARRSFATNLAMRHVPVATISKFMGHADVKMTSKYICVDKSDMNDYVFDFFN